MASTAMMLFVATAGYHEILIVGGCCRCFKEREKGIARNVLCGVLRVEAWDELWNKNSTLIYWYF